MIDRRLRLLVVEDSAVDADLIVRALERGGYTLQHSLVGTEERLREALSCGAYDLVITDHELGGLDSTDVLRIVSELAPELGCVLVSGKVGEEAVSQAMRHGAADFVSKDNLTRLPAGVARVLAEVEQRRERETAEAALARTGRFFEAVFVNARDGMLIVDDERRLVAANPAAAELFAMSRDDLVERRIEDLLPEASQVEAPTNGEFLALGERRGEVELLRADGELVATEYTVAADFLPGRHILVMRDIRERRAAEAEVRRRVAQQEAIADLGERALREKRLDLLMEAAVTRIVETLDVDIACILELRVPQAEFVVQAQVGLGHTGIHVVHGAPATSQASFTVHQREPVLVADYAHEQRFDGTSALSERGVRSALTVEIPGNEHPFGVLEAASRRPGAFNDNDGVFLTAVAHILVVALERARGEEEILESALHDSLTGLPNRTLFFDRLTLGLTRSKRLGTRLAVLFLDVDRFKALNDTLGHQAADELLAQVGARIAGTMRENDTVARFGGDEFVVLCEDLEGEAEVEALTVRLAAALDAPFSLSGDPHKLSSSIGVALSDEDNLDGEALLRDADIAMYHAKESGRGTWSLATTEMRVAALDRVETKRSLEAAIEANELRLHYQPIVALDGGQLCAVEALVRWQHPERGMMAPGEFIPLAEESKLILRLGEWVLRAACRQAAAWRAEFAERAPLPIHVNLSARQVAQLDLPGHIRNILEETGVRPADIALEITETALIEGRRGPMTTLAALKHMGLTIVLDDFGTGYSSLSYLERFPIDVLKIDRAFVSQLVGPGAPAPIVTAIVGMARALGVDTVAEGVETAQQTAAVAALGCKHAQGNYFARPAPAEHVTRLVRDLGPLRLRAEEANALLAMSPGPDEALALATG